MVEAQRVNATASGVSGRGLAAHRGALVDCDIHPSVPSTKKPLPYFDEYWRNMIVRRGLDWGGRGFDRWDLTREVLKAFPASSSN